MSTEPPLARRPMALGSLSYWSGAGKRFGPALAVGSVAAVVAWLFGDQWTAVALVAGGAFLAALLLPAQPPS